MKILKTKLDGSEWIELRIDDEFFDGSLKEFSSGFKKELEALLLKEQAFRDAHKDY